MKHDLDITFVSNWTNGKMSSRAEYYSGRGPLSCDLNSEHLEMIFEGIKKDAGEKEAEAFVDMVEDLKDMSATAFLIALGRFLFNDCQWVKNSQEKGSGNTIESRGEAAVAVGMGCVVSALGDRRSQDDRDRDSVAIKAAFLRRHERELPNFTFYCDPWLTR